MTRRRAAVLACLFAAAPIVATPTGAAAQAPSVPPAVAEFAARLQPHRALYEFTASHIDVSSEIVDVRGVLSYEVAETCADWRSRHRFRIDILRLGETRTSIETRYESTEGKDGNGFSFRSETLQDGVRRTLHSGTATRFGRRGEIAMTEPGPRIVPLPEGTMFPIMHTLHSLAAAAEGRPFFWATLFDGSEGVAVTGMNVAVLPGAEAPLREGASALERDAGWVFRVASYAATPEPQATYEMRMRLNGNGVVPVMELDYGEFAVEGVVTRIEALDKPDC